MRDESRDFLLIMAVVVLFGLFILGVEPVAKKQGCWGGTQITAEKK